MWKTDGPRPPCFLCDSVPNGIPFKVAYKVVVEDLLEHFHASPLLPAMRIALINGLPDLCLFFSFSFNFRFDDVQVIGSF
jgi:hypothetical protein